MTRGRTPLLIAAAAVAGCTLGARDIDYSRERGISDDIGAVHDRGPTPLHPGMDLRDEPIGAFPLDLDQRHQVGR